jgi:Leucine-rich repeat (LRR) protein
MNDKNDFALVRKPSSAVEKAEPGTKRVLSGMVADTLALAAKTPATPAVAKFRIGDYDWYGPDYQQILLWAEETHRSPEFIVRRLVEMKSSFEDGRLIAINWDDGSMPVKKMRFVEGLRMKVLHLLGGARNIGIISTLKAPQLGVTPMDFELSEISLDGLSELEVLAVSQQNLRELDLRQTPKLKRLFCESNVLSRLDLSRCRGIEEISVRNNELSELELLNLPALKSLDCSQNQLSFLDLSGAPALEFLNCKENSSDLGGHHSYPIEVLDITPLKNLKVLKYDTGGTRLIQRADQHF